MQKMTSLTDLISNIISVIQNTRYILEHIDKAWLFFFILYLTLEIYNSDNVVATLKNNCSKIKFMICIYIALKIITKIYLNQKQKKDNENKTTKPGIGIVKLSSELTKEETENKMFFGKLKNEVEEFYEIKSYSTSDIPKYYKNGTIDKKIFKDYNLKLIFIVSDETGYDSKNNNELVYRLKIEKILFDNNDINGERKKQIDYELKTAFNKYIKIIQNDNLNQRESGANLLKIQISNIMAMIFEASGNIKENKKSMKFLYDNLKNYNKKKSNNKINYIKKNLSERIINSYNNYLKLLFRKYNSFKFKSFTKEFKKTIDEKKLIIDELYKKNKITEEEYTNISIEIRLLYAFYFLLIENLESVYEIFNNLYFENKLPSLSINNLLEIVTSTRNKKMLKEIERYYAILETVLFERTKLNTSFKNKNSKKIIIKTIIKTWIEIKEEKEE